MANDVKYVISLCSQDCATLDPIDLGYWREAIEGSYAVSGVDVYGSLGFIGAKNIGNQHSKFCSLYCYCDGPTDDGVTPDWQWERYETRWIAVFEFGEMFYGKVGDVLSPAPAELFPDTPFEGVIKISMSFDMNARPCFCMEYESGLIEIRRFEAGSYQKYSFNGKSPVLIQNGILQYDLDLRDVVCYYIDGTTLKARFQRDEFATDYDILTDLTQFSLKVTDRGREELASVHILETESVGGTQTIFFVNYPPWPIYQGDLASVRPSLNSDLLYFPAIVQFNGFDSAASSAAMNSDVVYFPQTVTPSSESDSASSSASINSDVSYLLALVSTTTSEPTIYSSAAINSDANYVETIVPFSISESASSVASFNSDIDYSL